jgi:putative transposase
MPFRPELKFLDRLEVRRTEMSVKRKQHSGALKAKAAVDAIKGQRTISELASQYGVHPTQITKWKKQAIEGLPTIFSNQKEKAEKKREDLESELYQQIGQLKVELDWVKKKSGLIDR